MQPSLHKPEFLLKVNKCPKTNKDKTETIFFYLLFTNRPIIVIVTIAKYNFALRISQYK